MKNLYLYLILVVVIAIYFYYYQYHRYSFVEGYKNSKVFIGENPSFSRNNILLIDDDDVNFGSDSIYETGKIRNPNDPNKDVYGSTFGNVYGSSYTGYYNYS